MWVVEIAGLMFKYELSFVQVIGLLFLFLEWTW